MTKKTAPPAAGSMSRERFNAIREELGLSLSQLARVLGLTGAHAVTRLKRWQTGRLPVSDNAAALLERLAAGWRPDNYKDLVRGREAPWSNEDDEP